jgi:hypothetical protein
MGDERISQLLEYRARCFRLPEGLEESGVSGTYLRDEDEEESGIVMFDGKFK